MKKLGLILLSGALLFGLTACGGSTEEETKAPATEQTEKENVVAASASGVEEFTLTATNWEFASDKELVVKKGTKVKLNLVNKEGIHAVGNEELGIDLAANKSVEFTADTTGEYELICSIVCGALKDHDDMKIKLKVID
ncbi:hypothetical protein [Bacillus sp. MRMR6]|uniref:hypothetical protein n=1 Tax=Bacillus sp. MRMR6 TaxID=1928617 RepID=UPI0009521FD4|nr:hypothetical protein [Bacillus sp. MRMR6]OLS41325.1 hypothetical protein BTR25_05565 [Bacillus sp. MRMR6]